MNLDVETVEEARDAFFAEMRETETMEGDPSGEVSLLGHRFNIMGADYFMADIYHMLLDTFGEEAGGILQSTGIKYGEDLMALTGDAPFDRAFGRLLGLLGFLGYSKPRVEETAVVFPASPTAVEYTEKGYEERATCYFLAGILTGGATTRRDDLIRFEETACRADGDDSCWFELTAMGDAP